MNVTDIVAARFLEWADTEDRRHAKGLSPSNKSGFWIEVGMSLEEYRNWQDGKAYEEHRRRVWDEMPKGPPSAAAIQRGEAVQDWIIEAIESPEHRKSVQFWARCIVRERSYAGWCKATGRHPRTSLKRVQRTFVLIERFLRRKSAYPTLPLEKWLFLIGGKNGTFSPTLRIENMQAAVENWADPKQALLDEIEGPAQLDAAMANKRRRRDIERAAA